MSNIPSSAMPHAYAEEGVDLRNPHGGEAEETSAQEGLPMGLLLAGAAAAGFLLYRVLR